MGQSVRVGTRCGVPNTTAAFPRCTATDSLCSRYDVIMSTIILGVVNWGVSLSKPHTSELAENFALSVHPSVCHCTFWYLV